ncbi:MAG: type II toxin-antitoxin system RelE/ParE family toxin [Anaerolineaceae bacterium]|nr:type II toxin-antitoxin system RelE/ParE family toxin [Anaerolineaceae bacterium]
MNFKETSIFTKQITELLSDDEYRKLQSLLNTHPNSGPIIPGTGGLRKLRWKVQGRGKSGGIRVIYYWFDPKDEILMLFMFLKNQQANLTAYQKKMLERAVKEEYHGK